MYQPNYGGTLRCQDPGWPSPSRGQRRQWRSAFAGRNCGHLQGTSARAFPERDDHRIVDLGYRHGRRPLSRAVTGTDPGNRRYLDRWRAQRSCQSGRYRELARFRRELVDDKKAAPGRCDGSGFASRGLPWRWNIRGVWTPRSGSIYDHYKPSDLAQALNLPGYRTMTTSWAEKREDIDESVASLPQPLRSQVLERLQGTPCHAAAGRWLETSCAGFCDRDPAFYGQHRSAYRGHQRTS